MNTQQMIYAEGEKIRKAAATHGGCRAMIRWIAEDMLVLASLTIAMLATWAVVIEVGHIVVW